MKPIAMVDTPIIASVAIKEVLRPRRSPKWPNIAAPIGLAANPTKYVENESSVPTNGSDCGKYFCGKTSAAATPYRKKSYHSIDVPTADATIARTICCRRRASLNSSRVDTIGSFVAIPYSFVCWILIGKRRYWEKSECACERIGVSDPPAHTDSFTRALGFFRFPVY